MNRLSLAAGVALIASSLARPAAADEELSGYQPPHVMDYTGGRIPSYAHLETRVDRKMLDVGLGVAGSVYALSVIYALGTCGAQMACRSGSEWL